MTKLEDNETKTAQIRVRLAAAPNEDSANVKFTLAELTFVKGCADSAGYRPKYGVSTYIRDMGEAAAADENQMLSPADVLRSAAARSNMSLGAWLRVVVLSVDGGYPLRRQMALANDAMKRKIEDHR